jgi:kynurenine formamidase
MKLIDLSHIVSPELPGVEFQQARILGKEGWNAKTLSMYSHSGTHVDSPIHFGLSKEGLDKIPLEKFIANAWVVDCTFIESKGLLEVDHLKQIAGKVQAGDGLIFKTNWSHKFGTAAYRDDLPRISEPLACWIVEKGVSLIGVEPPSVADVNSIEELTRIHQILLSGEVTIVEGLTNLEAIKEDKVLFLAFPLKIEDGDGCPVRAVAIEN